MHHGLDAHARSMTSAIVGRRTGDGWRLAAFRYQRTSV
jgi:hypothetical protein